MTDGRTDVTITTSKTALAQLRRGVQTYGSEREFERELQFGQMLRLYTDDTSLVAWYIAYTLLNIIAYILSLIHI